jgi:hypothetical protein
MEGPPKAKSKGHRAAPLKVTEFVVGLESFGYKAEVGGLLRNVVQSVILCVD